MLSGFVWSPNRRCETHTSIRSLNFTEKRSSIVFVTPRPSWLSQSIVSVREMTRVRQPKLLPSALAYSRLSS